MTPFDQTRECAAMMAAFEREEAAREMGGLEDSDVMYDDSPAVRAMFLGFDVNPSALAKAADLVADDAIEQNHSGAVSAQLMLRSVYAFGFLTGLMHAQETAFRLSSAHPSNSEGQE